MVPLLTQDHPRETFVEGLDQQHQLLPVMINPSILLNVLVPLLLISVPLLAGYLIPVQLACNA